MRNNQRPTKCQFTVRITLISICQSTLYIDIKYWSNTVDDAGEKTMELSEQQLQVLKAIHEGKSVFMTGSAGTGKSYLLKVAIRDLRRMYGGDNVFVTASTGLAASELGGTTINAFAGVGLGKDSGQKLFSKVMVHVV